jgi:hypothetical protein
MGTTPHAREPPPRMTLSNCAGRWLPREANSLSLIDAQAEVLARGASEANLRVLSSDAG